MIRIIEDLQKLNNMNEASLSRLWQHTKDANTFAIIGSHDKKMNADRYDELTSDLKQLRLKGKIRGEYNILQGRYVYDDDTAIEENSIIIYEISKDDALKLCKKFHQETIIWKDKDFFGIINPDGSVDIEFENQDKNLNFSDSDVQLIGSHLKKDNPNGKPRWFKFEYFLRTMRHYKNENILLFEVYNENI